jgi:hypothetical protein
VLSQHVPAYHGVCLQSLALSLAPAPLMPVLRPVPFCPFRWRCGIQRCGGVSSF